MLYSGTFAQRQCLIVSLMWNPRVHLLVGTFQWTHNSTKVQEGLVRCSVTWVAVVETASCPRDQVTDKTKMDG